jgi:HAE1 family hydrophobic/amphiphilic exporter-1
MKVVRLGQVAAVQDGFAEQNGYSLRNGNPNVGISITRSRDASSVSVAEAVRAMVKEIEPELPSGTSITITQDGGEEASIYLNNVIEALIFGAGLTIFVVYAFLNSWRSTLITALSLPTSAIAAFIAVWLAGYTLNFMTLLGLSLAVGVLIDDAIVVRENIVRHMERGEDRVTAARNGTAEIGLAVAATTFSIMAVFVPVAFMGGVAGEWFRPFAPDGGGIGDGEPVHLLHARPDAVGLLGRSAGLRTIARKTGLGTKLARPSMNGSITRPTATAASSPGRCITACGWR